MIMIIIFIQDSPISVINTGIKGGPVVRVHKQKYFLSKWVDKSRTWNRHLSRNTGDEKAYCMLSLYAYH